MFMFGEHCIDLFLSFLILSYYVHFKAAFESAAASFAFPSVVNRHGNTANAIMESLLKSARSNGKSFYVPSAGKMRERERERNF